MSKDTAIEHLYLRPLDLGPSADAAAEALPLAGGRLAFSRVELLTRTGGRRARRPMAVTELQTWSRAQPQPIRERLELLLGNLTRPRPPQAGLAYDRPQLMAVLNVTPDSFSDGGDYFDPVRAIAHGLELQAAGADLIDVGGESTRPGAFPVSPEEEARRVLPVVAALAARGVRVSIDSRHAMVMRAALAAGAVMINDVSALTSDRDSMAVAAASTVPLVLMHMQGEPDTMQDAPRYQDVSLDVYDWLERRVAACRAAGVACERLILDPGIGFGKTVAHNLQLLRELGLFHGLGVPLLIGVSRKRFIAALSRNEPPAARVPGTIAACLAALNQGCQLLRVHDLPAVAQAVAIWNGLNPGPPDNQAPVKNPA